MTLQFHSFSSTSSVCGRRDATDIAEKKSERVVIELIDDVLQICCFEDIQFIMDREDDAILVDANAAADLETCNAY